MTRYYLPPFLSRDPGSEPGANRFVAVGGREPLLHMRWGGYSSVPPLGGDEYLVKKSLTALGAPVASVTLVGHERGLSTFVVTPSPGFEFFSADERVTSSAVGSADVEEPIPSDEPIPSMEEPIPSEGGEEPVPFPSDMLGGDMRYMVNADDDSTVVLALGSPVEGFDHALGAMFDGSGRGTSSPVIRIRDGSVDYGTEAVRALTAIDPFNGRRYVKLRATGASADGRGLMSAATIATAGGGAVELAIGTDAYAFTCVIRRNVVGTASTPIASLFNVTPAFYSHRLDASGNIAKWISGLRTFAEAMSNGEIAVLTFVDDGSNVQTLYKNGVAVAPVAGAADSPGTTFLSILQDRTVPSTSAHHNQDDWFYFGCFYVNPDTRRESVEEWALDQWINP